jgi:hypothetical protein
MLSNLTWNVKRKSLLELDQFRNQDGFLPISPTHHDVVKLLVVWELLPPGSDDLVSLFALEFG